MKGLKVSAISTICMVVVLITAFVAYGGVQFSRHDFTITGDASGFSGSFSGDNDEVCVYCHTPHSALGQQTPLWNKTLRTNPGDFIMYSSATIDATIPNMPSKYSLMCLSCHDGVSAINATLNSPGPGNPGMPGSPNYIGYLCDPLSQFVNIGDACQSTDPIDLSNDHPVSIQYNSDLVNKDGGLYPQPQDSRLRLYEGMVECPTCHDPHNGDLFPGEGMQFMRMPNAGSQMCLSCHIK